MRCLASVKWKWNCRNQSIFDIVLVTICWVILHFYVKQIVKYFSKSTDFFESLLVFDVYATRKARMHSVWWISKSIPIKVNWNVINNALASPELIGRFSAWDLFFCWAALTKLSVWNEPRWLDYYVYEWAVRMLHDIIFCEQTLILFNIKPNRYMFKQQHYC